MAYTNKEDTFAQATADLALIAFYYLLRIGEYTIKDKEYRRDRKAEHKTNSAIQTRGCNVLFEGQEGKNTAITTQCV
jgi:hypothetical protein